MKLSSKILLSLYRQNTFPKWAKSGKNDLFRPSDRRLESDGSVVWDMRKTPSPCSDHLEMSGFFASAILSYGKSAKSTLRICRHLVVPNLRMQPNVTQSSFKRLCTDCRCSESIFRLPVTKIPFFCNVRIRNTQSKRTVRCLILMRCVLYKNCCR